MSAILLHLFCAALYLGLAFCFWRRRWRGPVLNQPAGGLSIPERISLLAILAMHAVALLGELVGQGELRFGFGVAVSMLWWLALALYWIESFYARMEGLLMLALPLAALGVVTPQLFPATHALSNIDSPMFRAHFMIAMLAYSLFALAALHGVLMMVTERSLRQGRLPWVLANLPPLLTMESLLFRLIHVAFALLTLTVLSGVFFSEAVFGKALSLNHKTVFALLSWATFAALLVGRHRYGWRGQLALRWALAGFAALLLSYFGSQFVIEVILGRAA